MQRQHHSQETIPSNKFEIFVYHCLLNNENVIEYGMVNTYYFRGCFTNY